MPMPKGFSTAKPKRPSNPCLDDAFVHLWHVLEGVKFHHHCRYCFLGGAAKRPGEEINNKEYQWYRAAQRSGLRELKFLPNEGS